MLETLKEKLLSWTPAAAESFYGNVTRYSSNGGSIWEKTSTGWYLYSPIRTEYIDLNGRTYVLEEGDKTDSLTAKQQYSDYAQTNNLFRMENVTTFSLVEIHGILYTYSEHIRPYNSFGFPFLNLVNVTSNKAATVLDLTTKFIKALDDLYATIDACSGSFYPKEINVEHFFYDNVQDKFFWAGDIEFSLDRQESLITHNAILAVAEQYLNDIVDTTLNIQPDINNFVNTECTTLQLP